MTEIGDITTAKGLKLCHLNIRSLFSKLEVFRIEFQHSGFDIITLSETWLTRDINSSVLELPGYQLYRNDRCTQKRGGGLATYVHKDLNFTCSHDCTLNVSEIDCEVQRVELCSAQQKSIIIYNVYRQPSGNVETFVDSLSACVDKEVDFHKKEFVCMGDFNINMKNKMCPDKRKLVNWQNKIGLKQLINTSTRCSKKSQSLIDLVFTNMDHCHDYGILNLHLSDHQPVYVIKKKVRCIRKTTSFVGRSYVNYSKELLSDFLTHRVRAEFRRQNDPNACWDIMEQFLTDFLDQNCPIKSFRTKDKTPMWVTREVILLGKDRDRAWKKARLSNNDEDWENAKRLRNWANNASKAAKAHYLQNELNNNLADPKKFWRNIKTVLPDSNEGNINIINPLNQTPLPQNLQAHVQEINHFFANVGQNLARKFDGDILVIEAYDDQVPRLEIPPITQVEILKLIDTISVYKSSGLDNISSRVLKDFMYLARGEFTLLFNKIIESGIFPDKWKIATVTPIPKVTCASEPTDLRPISLLPVPGKLLEKYITAKISTFLENNNYFAHNQNGFRKGKFTANAVSTFLDDVVTDLNGGKINLAVYLDFKKAFDTFEHEILVNKLRQAGLGDKVLGLLKNYLGNRKQRTKLFDVTSDLEDVGVGVPQGSIVGPMMFIIFINDLIKVLKHCKLLLYADDTVIYCGHQVSKVVQVEATTTKRAMVRGQDRP